MKIFVFIFALLCPALSSAAIVVNGSGGVTPDFLAVSRVGVFPIEDGSCDLRKLIVEKEKEMGRKMEIPNKLQIFFPATEKTAAFLTSVDYDEIEKSAVVNLPSIPSRSAENNVYRVFYGPRLVDQTGSDVLGASIWFVGEGGQSRTVSAGLVNPATNMSKDQEEITAVIYAPGYELKVVDVTISEEAIKDGEVKPPLAESNILLNPALYQNFGVGITNYSNKLYEGISGDASYFRDESGNYWFYYHIRDQHQKKEFIAGHKLISGARTVPESLEIKPISEMMPGLQAVKSEELPANLPSITAKPSFLLAAVGPSKSFDVPKVDEGEFDPKLKAGIIFIIASFVFAFVIFFNAKLRAEAREKKKQRQADEERYAIWMLGRCGVIDQGAYFRAARIANNKSLNELSREFINKTLAKVNALLKDVENKIVYRNKLVASLDSHSSYRQARLASMRQNIEAGQYDLAMAIKTQIEESEKQSEAISGTLTDLDGVIANRKNAVQALMSTLEKMTLRAQGLIDQVEGAEGLTDLGAEAKSIMDGLLKSFGSESSVELDPSEIEKHQDERRRAEQTGVSANDIEDLKDFIERRSKK